MEMKQNILVIGSGGREHAIASAFEKSEKVARVYVAPGNPGMNRQSKKIQTVPLQVTDNEGLIRFAKEEVIDISFVGPEAAFEVGLVNDFREQGLKIVGPTKEAGKIESSKVFAKELMTKAGIPTAQFKVFEPSQFEQAKIHIDTLPLPIVIKENGLAAGKGVFICESRENALEELEKAMKEKQSDVVIEEYMEGPEFSHFSLVNEDHVIPLGIARDYKRAYDQNKGPNTGGMGAVSPISDQDNQLNDEVLNLVVHPLLAEMKKEGKPYTGILYTGIMETTAGLKVIEFNARFGDPETQILLPLIETDLVDVISAHFDKTDLTLTYSNKQSLGVVLAAQGYPGQCENGFELPIPAELPKGQIYFGGVVENNGKLLASGGRLLMVTSQADTIRDCRKDVEYWLERIDSDQSFYRTDIGLEMID